VPRINQHGRAAIRGHCSWARFCHAGLEDSLHELGGAPPDRTDVGRAGRERRERPVVHRLVAWVAQRHTLIATEADRVGLTIEISEVPGPPDSRPKANVYIDGFSSIAAPSTAPLQEAESGGARGHPPPQRADQTDPLLHTARVTAPERS
jgi:hypothetical protein